MNFFFVKKAPLWFLEDLEISQLNQILPKNSETTTYLFKIQTNFVSMLKST